MMTRGFERAYLTLIPAYGREYKNKKEVLADWHAGKDFEVAGGEGYINLEGAKQYGVVSVNIRYKKLTQVCVVKVAGEPIGSRKGAREDAI